MPEATVRWDIVIKIAIETAEETEARWMADVLLGKMGVIPAEALPFVHFDDGTWSTETHVDGPEFYPFEPSDPQSVLSDLTMELGPVQWTGQTDTPSDPESARVAWRQWPPSYWALAGRQETLVHPSVRAVLLPASRRR